MPPLSIEIVLSAISWLVVVWRFLFVLRDGRITQSNREQRVAWYMWAMLFSIVLTGTSTNYVAAQLIARQTGAWFTEVPKWLFVLAFLWLWVLVCYEIAPHLGQHRWAYAIGVVALAAYIFVMWVASRSGRDASYYDIMIAGPILEYYTLLVVARVMYPAISWSHSHEKQKPMQLRFKVMFCMLTGAAVYIINDFIRMAAIQAGFSYQAAYEPIRALSLTAVAATMLIACLTPASHYIHLVQAGEYPSSLLSLFIVRVVFVRARSFVGRTTKYLERPSEMIHHPAQILYQNIIEIFDCRKSLKAHPVLAARRLGQRLDEAAKPDLDYAEIVRRVRQIGAGYIFNLAARKDR